MYKKSLSVLYNLSKLPNKNVLRSYSVYEPPYLELMKPKYPLYETINIQIKGYDYAVLESYQKLLHNIAETMDLEVTNGWAYPPQHYKVQRFKPHSAIVDSEFKLTLYERMIQISDIGAPSYPLLLRIAQAALPEGVTLSVVEHTDDQEERRYVPDRDLKELEQQLDEMGGPVQKKKGKK